MPKPPARRDLSLKWLELFDICAERGSLQAAAQEMNLSASTVSHHLARLEEALGVQLIDHGRKPVVITPAGQRFRKKIAGALHDIRGAQADLVSGSVDGATFLRIGLIEDFDSDIAPTLAVRLAKRMPNCDFHYHTDTSHEIVNRLRNRTLDLGVVAYSAEDLADLQDDPFLRDPYLVISPAEDRNDAQHFLAGQSDLPFLRFSNSLNIGRQIETQLRRHDYRLENRFECANSNTIMAMVAAGAGWAITTALLYAHGDRFHERLAVQRFPGKSFSRRLSVVSTPECAPSLRNIVRNHISSSLTRDALPSLHQNLAWLRDSFIVLE